jgi:hypothetical protein
MCGFLVVFSLTLVCFAGRSGAVAAGHPPPPPLRLTKSSPQFGAHIAKQWRDHSPLTKRHYSVKLISISIQQMFDGFVPC